MADWVTIRSEYISTQISTRDLAKKHGVPYSTLRKRAEKEAWAQLRSKQGRIVDALVAQKTAEAVSDAEADRITHLMAAGAKAARILSEQLDRMEESGDISTYEIRAIVESLKHVRDLYKSSPAPDSNLQKARELLGGVPDGLD